MSRFHHHDEIDVIPGNYEICLKIAKKFETACDFDDDYKVTTRTAEQARG